MNGYNFGVSFLVCAIKFNESHGETSYNISYYILYFIWFYFNECETPEIMTLRTLVIPILKKVHIMYSLIVFMFLQLFYIH